MKTKEEIKNLVVNSYWGHLSKSYDAIYVGSAIIFIDHVVDYVFQRQSKEVDNCVFLIGDAVEYFCS